MQVNPYRSMHLSLPIIASTIQAAVGGPVPTADTCSGEGSFTITADAAPNLDGCFEVTEFSTDDVPATYTVSATTDTAQIVVASVLLDSGDVSF